MDNQKIFNLIVEKLEEDPSFKPKVLEDINKAVFELTGEYPKTKLKSFEREDGKVGISFETSDEISNLSLDEVDNVSGGVDIISKGDFAKCVLCYGVPYLQPSKLYFDRPLKIGDMDIT